MMNKKLPLIWTNGQFSKLQKLFFLKPSYKKISFIICLNIKVISSSFFFFFYKRIVLFLTYI